MSSNFYNERNENNLEKIHAICEELPNFVNSFFIGIQLRTSSLTRLNYAYDIRIFFDFVSKKLLKNNVSVCEIVLADLEKITAMDIEIFLDYLSSYMVHGKKFRCGEKAKERKLSTLRTFFKYFFKKDLLTSNVTTKVDLPKIHDKPIVRLEIDEVANLLNQVDSGDALTTQQKVFHSLTQKRDSALLTLFLGTGIRISECVGLNKNDIDFSINGFNVTRKGGNKSILYFSEEVAKALKEYLAWQENEINIKSDYSKKITNHDALFLSLLGNRLSVRAVENIVKKYSQLVTPLKKITPHKLRSTYGTALYRETQDIYIVADVLGHKDINTTKKHYAAMSDEIRRNAASKVKLRDD